MRKRSHILLVFLLITFTFYGQKDVEVIKNKPDSIHKVLSELYGISRIDSLNNLARTLSPTNPDGSLVLASFAMQLSESFEYKKGKADAIYNTGLTYLFLDSLKTSIIHFFNALRLYEELDPSLEMAETLDQLQAINFMVGRYEKSKEYARRAIHVLDKLGLTRYKSVMFYTLGLTCTENLEFDSASFYNRKALRLLDECKGEICIGYMASACINEGYNLGMQYEITGDTASRTESLWWHLQALKYSEEFKDTMLIALSLTNLGWAYNSFDSDDSLQKGMEYTHRQLKLSRQLKIRIHLTLNAYDELALIEYNKGNVKQAISMLSNGLEVVKTRMENFSVEDYPSAQTIIWDRHYYLVALTEAYRNLSMFNEEKGSYDEALEYYILMGNAETELKQKENKDILAMLEAESENEKAENRIAGLERDRQMSELRASQSRNFNIGLVILVLVLTLLSLLFLRQNKIKNENRNTLLEQKLLRLQMNPHFIFNALSGIHNLMNPLNVDRASRYLGNFSRLLRSTLESSREDYILLEEEIDAIRNYLELQGMRFDNKFKYTINVDPGINLEAAIIPPMLIQPFIENAIEHGIRNKQDKGHVNIRFRLEENKIICEIEDDGVGREKAWETAYTKKGQHKSLATEIIRERIHILNRKFRKKISLNIIDLSPGSNKPSGTLVRLDLPYILD